MASNNIRDENSPSAGPAEVVGEPESAVGGACGNSPSGSCFWKREYEILTEQFELYKVEYNLKAVRQCEEMEIALASFKSGVDRLKVGLESETKKLADEKKALETENEALRNGMKEVMNVSKDQMDHANRLRQAAETQCEKMQELVRLKDEEIQGLQMRLKETVSRSEMLSKELGSLDGQLNDLRQEGLDQGPRVQIDLKKLKEACDLASKCENDFKQTRAELRQKVLKLESKYKEKIAQVEALEKTIRTNKATYTKALKLAEQKIGVYEDLVQKLWEKIGHDAAVLNGLMKSTSGVEKLDSEQSTDRSIGVTFDTREDTEPGETKIAAFKFMLEQAEEILKQIEDSNVEVPKK